MSLDVKLSNSLFDNPLLEINPFWDALNMGNQYNYMPVIRYMKYYVTECVSFSVADNIEDRIMEYEF